MGNYMLHLAQEENIILGAGAVNRLIASRNADAALLYLCLARRGAAEPDKLKAELGWGERQFSAAESALRSMGLVGPAAPEPRPVPAVNAPAMPGETTAPEYSREDIMDKLDSDSSFAALLREVERKLGRLSEPSLRKLLGLYDFLGLPADVIFLLVNYCAERKEEQFGAGKPPTMREVEKEGYLWARLELFTFAAADAYLKKKRETRSRFPDYMNVLGFGGRSAVQSEENNLRARADMGFPPEKVAIAYDKTMFKCHEFKWPYCNGILKRWHEKGLHTPQVVRAESAAPPTAKASADEDAWMDEFIQ